MSHEHKKQDLECESEDSHSPKRGKRGKKGSPGPRGKKGSPGPRGKKGSPGSKGDKGDKGDYGAKGDMGRIGRKGKKGSPGPIGAIGIGWEGPRGHQGPEGERGHHGHTGHTGHTGYTGPHGHTGAQGTPGQGFQGVQAYVVNSSTQTLPPSGTVSFDTINFSSHGVDVSTGGFTIQHAGKYLFDFYVRGVSDNPAVPLTFGLRANKSLQIPGTNVASGDNSSGLSQFVTGSSIVSFPDPLHGITTDVGTIIELQNVSTANITLKDTALNATLRVLKIN